MSAFVGRVRALPSVQVTLSIALLVLGFLVAAQIAAEGPRVAYSTQERSPLIDAALGLQTQQEALKASILDLRKRIGDLEAQDPGAAESLKKLYAQLEDARLAAGLVAVTGKGIAFKLEDGTQGSGVDALVSAQDVQVLIEELWLAGAEGISVNGERIVGSTAIIDIGGSILVNSAYLAPPYTISAIGPPDLYDRLQHSVAFIQFVQGRVEPSGLKLSVAPLDKVELPAFAGTVALRYAQPAPSGATP
ncbi:MAG: hypothetical protein QOI92_1778 [Chloroflexota bacterium]|jgi:uncharacterized protein YlxW (UPF0749 family)|nr:hypothetical protein [Chloroflexota bacterium]